MDDPTFNRVRTIHHCPPRYRLKLRVIRSGSRRIVPCRRDLTDFTRPTLRGDAGRPWVQRCGKDFVYNVTLERSKLTIFLDESVRCEEAILYPFRMVMLEELFLREMFAENKCSSEIRFLYFGKRTLSRIKLGSPLGKLMFDSLRWPGNVALRLDRRRAF